MRTDERRGTEWVFEAYERAEDDELRLRFRDGGLTITLHYRMRHDVVERWVSLDNEGPAVELLRADSATWTLPDRETGWRLSHLHGRWAAESQLVRAPLTYGEKVIGSRRGHTGHQHLPWVALDTDATEERGEVYGCALGWSGSWRIAVAELPDTRVQITGGAGYDESGLLRLEAGESFTAPVFAGLWSDAGFGGASRAWHAYQRAYVIPDADRDRPVLFNSWEATEFDISEEQQGVLARRAAAIGVELFVIDDGWFGKRTSDRAGLGDWTPNPDRFPGGLRPLADSVHALGMQFGIWVEPEMVNPDSDLYRAHPDWVQYQPGRKRTELRNQLVLNLAREDVQEYLWERLHGLLSSAPIDYVKWDFNRCFTDAGWPDDTYPQRLWVDHVNALYRLLDRLRQAHPGVAFESCSGGGGRIDLGVMSRTDQVWTSDNTDPLDRLAIQHGFSQIHPARVMAAWVTDSPNTQLNGRVSTLRFRFVSAMAGVLGVGGDLAEWTEEELAEARDWVTLYKEIRPLVQRGDLYRLRPPEGGSARCSTCWVTKRSSWPGSRRSATASRRDRLVQTAARRAVRPGVHRHTGLGGRGQRPGVGPQQLLERRRHPFPDDLFATARGGALAEYDYLKTYYAGYGANTNTTTRLRRYVGEAGVRPLVYDYTEPLLVANRPNRVRIVSDGSTVRWWNNGRLVFDLTDPEPYTSGHFGFRTTWSHFRISRFRVWRLPHQQR
ncbi:hypothetical protein SALBM311S_04266 [Streptomyces alboniger]